MVEAPLDLFKIKVEVVLVNTSPIESIGDRW